MKVNSLKKQKQGYLIYTRSVKAFKGTVVTRDLPSLVTCNFAYSPFKGPWTCAACPIHKSGSVLVYDFRPPPSYQFCIILRLG